MNLINKVKNNYKDIPDLKIRKIKYKLSYIYLFYIETICSSEQINDFILKNITNPNRLRKINNILPAPNYSQIKFNEIDNYLFNSFSILIYHNKIYALETKANLDRSINTPEIEPELYGPKDSFVENYQKNIGLIKRRIKSKDLKTKEFNIGKYTNTKVGLLYIEGLTKPEYIDKCKSILNNINIDGIIDSGELKKYIIKESSNLFPKVKLTEKPNLVAHSLLEGKIIIIVDTSPFAIIVPAVLADFINPISDNYLYANNANFSKILRLCCLFLTILTPAYYVAVANYNQETIPSKLLISFITQIEGVPFPTTIEALIMLLICEILRESDIRFPSSYGSAISILGALIIGEAAVNASIVSPIMIITIALTFISSMVFNNIELNSSLRSWRFLSLFIASIYGLYGVAISLILLIINLTSTYSFNLPYSFPASPFNFSYLKETLIAVKQKNNNKRSKYLTNNIRKQR